MSHPMIKCNYFLSFRPSIIEGTTDEDWIKLEEHLENALWTQFQHTRIRWEFQEVPFVIHSEPCEEVEENENEDASFDLTNTPE